MPVYVYRCAKCDTEFKEMLWPTESEASVRCPRCATSEVNKQLASFGVRSVTAKPNAGEPPPFCGRCGENRPPCGS